MGKTFYLNCPECGETKYYYTERGAKIAAKFGFKCMNCHQIAKEEKKERVRVRAEEKKSERIRWVCAECGHEESYL